MKKVLLDENLPRQLKNFFTQNISITTVPDLGWQSKQNGELLSAMADAKIDLLLTADRNLRFQQNIAAYPVKLIILITYNTRRKYLEQFVGEIESKILNWDGSNEFLEIDLRRNS